MKPHQLATVTALTTIIREQATGHVITVQPGTTGEVIHAEPNRLQVRWTTGFDIDPHPPFRVTSVEFWCNLREVKIL